MQKRIEYLDLIRVLAIISVIAIHIYAMPRDYYILTNKVYYIFFTFLDSLTRAGVPLFLILTGYFMLNKEENYKTFISKKMPKLIIPFFIWSCIYYVYNIYDKNLVFSIKELITGFTNNEICYHLWYMYIIIMIYIFIPYEKKLVDNLNKKELKRLIITIFIFGNSFLTVALYTKRYNYALLQSFCLPNLIIYNNYVLLGHYLKKYDIENKKVIYILGILSVILMPVVDYFFIDNNIRNDVMLTANSIFPIFYTLAIYNLVKDNYSKLKIKRWLKKIISNMSRLSLYIYLSHVLIMNILVKIINKYWIYHRFYESIIFTLVLLVLTTLLSYVLSILFDLLYNKIEKTINLQKQRNNI